MSTSLTIQCVLMLVLGQLAQLFLMKIPDMKKQARLANAQFIWKDWWVADWNLVMGTAVLGSMALIGLDELFHWKPDIMEYVKWFFAAIGALGSYVVMSKWSKYAAYFNEVIDVKTNKADGIEPPQP